AKEATKTIPIVFTLVGDPVGAGIVSKLAEPGANVTGVSSLQTELAAKRLEVLRSLAPAARRVWLIYYGVAAGSGGRGAPGTRPMIVKALDAGPCLGLEVVPRGVLDAAEAKEALRDLRRGDAIFVPEGSNPELAVAIIERSLALRVPAVFGTALW